MRNPGKSARPHARGFTLLELAVVAVIVGLLATALLNRVLFYQEQAEKTAVEQTLGTLRSALHLQIADVLINGKSGAIDRLAQQNPMSWLAEKPGNYVGEYYSPQPGLISAGNWYFDRHDKNLVYLATNTAHLHTSSGQANQLRFNLSVVTGSNDLAAAQAGDEEARRKAVVGVVLQTAKPYSWF
jgi:prepilin-type N-terminal cleavage/methylation domain-containing protein